MGTYDVMQVCLNGHKITDSYRSHREMGRKRCSECGEPTITSCPKCEAPIRGRYHVQNVADMTRGPSPAKYCHECGEPYPWTQRKIQAAQELIELADIDESEKHDLRDEVPNLVSDNPRSKVAAIKIKQFLQKAQSVVFEGARDLFVDISSETAKKVLTDGM